MAEGFFWMELLSNRVVSSVALVAFLATLRILAVRVIRGRKEILSDYRRAWLARIRNITVVLALAGLVLIWLPSLHAFALSITAFAVALVIAIKELILSQRPRDDICRDQSHPCRSAHPGTILVLAILLTLLVGISRVYLGVHWPTNVLAGWAALCWVASDEVRPCGADGSGIVANDPGVNLNPAVL